MSDEHRDKIRKSNILTSLIKCAEGKQKMSATQAMVGVALIKKVMPDLSSRDLNHGVQEDNPISSLLKDIASNGKRVTKNK